jgi:hypothetical protein
MLEIAGVSFVYMAWTKTGKGQSMFGVEAAIQVIAYLLMEDGGFLLQETDKKIVLNRAWDSDAKPVSGFTGVAKPVSGFTGVAKPVSGFTRDAKG